MPGRRLRFVVRLSHCTEKLPVYKNTSVCYIDCDSKNISALWEITCHEMRSHSVTCHQAAVTFPPIPSRSWYWIKRPRRDARLRPWVVVISPDSLPAKDGHLLQKNNRAGNCHGRELPESGESDVLTTISPSHLITIRPCKISVDITKLSLTQSN